MREIYINSIQFSGRRVTSLINIGGYNETIETTINCSFGVDVVADRIDAFVCGLLYFAMKGGYDIVSELPISDQLYYNLEYHFIDAIVSANNFLHRIRIKAPLVEVIQNRGNRIATGISCGVDSLYTVATHTGSYIPQCRKINTLAYFNAGSSPGNKQHSDLTKGRYLHAKSFAQEYGFDFIDIETNLHLVMNKYLPYSHIENHTYMALFLYASSSRCYINLLLFVWLLL